MAVTTGAVTADTTVATWGRDESLLPCELVVTTAYNAPKPLGFGVLKVKVSEVAVAAVTLPPTVKALPPVAAL